MIKRLICGIEANGEFALLGFMFGLGQVNDFADINCKNSLNVPCFSILASLNEEELTHTIPGYFSVNFN